MATVIVLSVTISQIFGIEIVHYHDLDIQHGTRSNENILINSSCMILYVMAVAMFAISVIISKRFAVEMYNTLL